MISSNIPCMYFSLEMDEISTMDRFLALRNGIPIIEWYAQGNAIDPLIKILDKERTQLINKPFRFIDDPSISLAEIEQQIKDFKLTMKSDYACIYIDLITQVKEFIDIGGSRGGNLATTIEIAVNRLNAMAKKLNVCIVAVAQMNRDADSAKIQELSHINNLRPTLNNVKNSNALGERSRVVISVFRPKYYAVRLKKK
jgi:replicative DNA helicase